MDELKKHLQHAQTMEQFLLICAQHYDFTNAKLGAISRGVLIQHIDKVIQLSGAKPKKK